MPNGEIMTSATKRDVQIVLKEGGGGGGTGMFETVVRGESKVTFKSKAVVISHGGRQELPTEFYNWFPSMAERKDRVVLSDYFL